MIVNVKATNKINGEVISYKLEGDGASGFLYEGTHMQEVADNKIREVNNNLILQGSTLKLTLNRFYSALFLLFFN